jgi:hypothetical protein
MGHQLTLTMFLSNEILGPRRHGVFYITAHWYMVCFCKIFTAPCDMCEYFLLGQEYLSESTGTLALGDHGMMQNLARKLEPNKNNNSLTVNNMIKRRLYNTNTSLVPIRSPGSQ